MALDPWASFNVLLIDDEPITRHLLNGLLQRLGFSAITVASNGDEALAILAEQEFDLILTDLEMPGTNGLALLQKIRCGATKQPRNTRIMVITSHEELSVLGTAIALDADAIINKTINIEQLKHRIDHLLLGPQPELRPAIAYEVIDTQKPLRHNDSSTTGRDADGGHQVTLDGLVEGMQLARPIVSESGYILMQRGESLTLGKIGLLQDLADYLDVRYVYINQ